MKFVGPEAQQAIMKEKLRRRMDTVLVHGKYIVSPEVRGLGKQLAVRAGTALAIGCASAFRNIS